MSISHRFISRKGKHRSQDEGNDAEGLGEGDDVGESEFMRLKIFGAGAVAQAIDVLS